MWYLALSLHFAFFVDIAHLSLAFRDHKIYFFCAGDPGDYLNRSAMSPVVINVVVMSCRSKHTQMLFRRRRKRSTISGSCWKTLSISTWLLTASWVPLRTRRSKKLKTWRRRYVDWDCHVTVMWLSCDSCVNFMWLSCDSMWLYGYEVMWQFAE